MTPVCSPEQTIKHVCHKEHQQPDWSSHIYGTYSYIPKGLQSESRRDHQTTIINVASDPTQGTINRARISVSKHELDLSRRIFQIPIYYNNYERMLRSLLSNIRAIH